MNCLKQECIPIGCIPSAAVGVCWGGILRELSAPGGVCSWRVSAPRGVSAPRRTAPGRSVPKGVSAPGDGVSTPEVVCLLQGGGVVCSGMVVVVSHHALRQIPLWTDTQV